MNETGIQNQKLSIRLANVVIVFLFSCCETAVLPDINISISPKNASIVIGEMLNFSAEITGTTNRGVFWYVNDILSGDSMVGTIDEFGKYIAPKYVPDPPSVTIKGVSRADTTKFDTAGVTIVWPIDQPILLWTNSYQIPSPATFGYLRGVVIDEEDNVIASGTISEGGQPPQAIVLSTDRHGQQRWIYAYESSASLRGIVIGPDFTTVLVAGELYNERMPLLFEIDSLGHKIFESFCSNMVGTFLKASRDDQRVYLAVSAGPAIVTYDYEGHLGCENPIDICVSDLSSPRIHMASPFNEGFLVSGDSGMSNECWSQGLYPFLQEISSTSQLLWRCNIEPLFSPTATSGSLPVYTVAYEGTERFIYFAVSRIEGCIQTNEARYLTGKLDENGNLLWHNLWDGDNSPISFSAFPYAIMPDPLGGAIIAGRGSSGDGMLWDAAVASYTATGLLRWTMKPKFAGYNFNACYGATTTSDGKFLYVVGGAGISGFTHLGISKYALPQ